MGPKIENASLVYDNKTFIFPNLYSKTAGKIKYRAMPVEQKAGENIWVHFLQISAALNFNSTNFVDLIKDSILCDAEICCI